jgi:hypothetical protein
MKSEKGCQFDEPIFNPAMEAEKVSDILIRQIFPHTEYIEDIKSQMRFDYFILNDVSGNQVRVNKEEIIKELLKSGFKIKGECIGTLEISTQIRNTKDQSAQL